VRSGLLRHEVTIQQPGTRVDDGYGGGSVVDSDVTTVWAAIEPLAGEERFVNGQFDPSISHRVRIRYYPGIRPSWKLKYGARVLNIKYAADVDERHREVVLMCEELPAP
jgi:SPP1 family predicted phage head-tail adaptor